MDTSRNTFKKCRRCKKNKNIDDFPLKNDGKHKATCIKCEFKDLVKEVLKKATEEQDNITKAIFNGYNVKVDAVAGSGKTTSILHIGKNFRVSNILVITYNKKLQEETKKKLKKYDLDQNIDIFTYHGSCNKFYTNKQGELITDEHIKEVVELNTKTNKIKYDIIIVDEVQDMNFNYCYYINKIIRDNKKADPFIIILGDENQCINQYNGSDARFLTLGDRIFKNEKEWQSLKLTETFRVPQEICDFLNNCMLKEERMVSNDGNGNPKYSGFKPRYFLKSSFTNIDSGCDYILREIDYYLDIKNEDGTNRYKPDDIFILAPSVKNKIDNQSPVNQLSNALSSSYGSKYGSKKLVYVNNDSDCVVDDKVLINKIVISTHNSVKGLERKVVIIMNFDNSYFLYYDKDSDPNVCPNRLYVAVTRSMERLSLFHHYEDDYLPFLLGDSRSQKLENIRKYCDVNPICKKPGVAFKLEVKEKETNIPHYAVTDLVKYLKVDVVLKLKKLYETKKINRERDYSDLNLINISEQNKNHWEVVSDINGTAIPLYFAMTECGYVNPTDEVLDGTNDNVTILKIANITNAMVDNSYYKVNQILNYNWLSHEQLDNSVKRLVNLKKEGFINDTGTFEHYSEIESETSDKVKFILGGQMDYANKLDKTILEFKCVENLDDSHILQTLLYKYINGDDYDNYYLYNIKSDELIKVSATDENLQKIVDILINNKKKIEMSDPEFLELANKGLSAD